MLFPCFVHSWYKNFVVAVLPQRGVRWPQQRPASILILHDLSLYRNCGLIQAECMQCEQNQCAHSSTCHASPQKNSLVSTCATSCTFSDVPNLARKQRGRSARSPLPYFNLTVQGADSSEICKVIIRLVQGHHPKSGSPFLWSRPVFHWMKLRSSIFIEDEIFLECFCCAGLKSLLRQEFVSNELFSALSFYFEEGGGSLLGMLSVALRGQH